MLPSGPGGVGRFSSRGAQPSSPLLGAQSNTPAPRAGIPPRWSGLRVQGTATSPPSTATLDHATTPRHGPPVREGMAEREGFEPSIRLLDVYTISSRAPSAARAPLPGPAGAPHRVTAPRRKNGGGGGIRTHVRTHRPQLDFESSPVRPLRYPSARRFRKNACTSALASAASTPSVTAHPMVPRRLVEHPRVADDRAGLRVRGAEHEGADPRVHARARAHHARLHGHVERRAGQPVVPHAAPGVPQGLESRRAPSGPTRRSGRLCPRPTTLAVRGPRRRPPAPPRPPRRPGPPRARRA